MKKTTPIEMAIAAIIFTNLPISIEISVSPASAVYARDAIYPITVLSPVLKTTPVPDPLVQAVPKKATLDASKIFL